MIRGGAVSAVILAAGAGTRLGALGLRYSKAMLPVAERPLIAWVITTLGMAGVSRVIVVGHPSDTRLAEYLRDTHPNLTLVAQPERLGIADALCWALPQISDVPGYLACACDSIFAPADIGAVIRTGRGYPGSAVVGVLEMGAAATAARSSVRVDGTRVVEIIEKPRPQMQTSGLVAMPLYWLPQTFAPYLRQTVPLAGERYVSTALRKFIGEGGSVRAVHVSERIEVTAAADIEVAAARLRAGKFAVEPVGET
jgi:dTDP-glucose pyrophosphorylase